MDMKKYEKALYKKGFACIVGIDEVGRGPLVGSVVAAAVVLSKDFELEGLTDSKKLSEKKRNEYFHIIKEKALHIGIGIVSSKEIDEINIYNASKKAMIKAMKEIEGLEYALIDGNMKFDIDIPYESIVKGDSKSISIAAASVIAKVTRDKEMYELDKKYPMYDFKNNKGYPTKKHLEAIKKYGILDEHRKSYKPVMDVINNNKGKALITVE